MPASRGRRYRPSALVSPIITPNNRIWQAFQTKRELTTGSLGLQYWKPLRSKPSTVIPHTCRPLQSWASTYPPALARLPKFLSPPLCGFRCSALCSPVRTFAVETSSSVKRMGMYKGPLHSSVHMQGADLDRRLHYPCPESCAFPSPRCFFSCTSMNPVKSLNSLTSFSSPRLPPASSTSTIPVNLRILSPEPGVPHCLEPWTQIKGPSSHRLHLNASHSNPGSSCIAY